MCHLRKKTLTCIFAVKRRCSSQIGIPRSHHNVAPADTHGEPIDISEAR